MHKLRVRMFSYIFFNFLIFAVSPIHEFGLNILGGLPIKQSVTQVREGPKEPSFDSRYTKNASIK